MVRFLYFKRGPGSSTVHEVPFTLVKQGNLGHYDATPQTVVPVRRRSRQSVDLHERRTWSTEGRNPSYTTVKVVYLNEHQTVDQFTSLNPDHG